MPIVIEEGAMRKMSGWILTAGLILGGAARARGQTGFAGASGGQVPSGVAEMQETQDRLMREVAPELYAFQKKLRDIDAKIDGIVAKLSKQEIDKDAAKEEMLPLIKEQQEIRNDPEFLVEQRLSRTYFSSPEYRAKAEKVMRALADKKKAQATR
jgi:peptidoglycan hydrolase CwlO-like protein